jgi:2-amino-4-hydroxy-6-hydroxymethyldihydropteridine diphosphokinase
MPRSTYLIALGSNRRHIRYGRPEDVIRAAARKMDKKGIKVKRLSSVHRTVALGPAGRDFANAAALVKTRLSPPELLRKLKKMERKFGRRHVRRWGPRVLDLDIILWSGGAWPSRLGWHSARDLAVPHRAMDGRDFVLSPALEVAPDWRHPLYGLSIRQMHARLRQSKH